MIQLLRAGLLAAQHQLGLVIVITIGWLMALHLLADAGDQSADAITASFLAQSPPYLSWAYLLAGVGMAATTGEHIVESVEGMRRLAKKGNRDDANHFLKLMFAHLVLTAILCGVMVLHGPPDGLFEAVKPLGYGGAVAATWAGFTSIGVAGFGASAHAVRKALLNSKID